MSQSIVPSLTPLDTPLPGLAPEGAASRPIHAWRPAQLQSCLAALPPHQAAYLRAQDFTAAARQLVLLPDEPGGHGIAAAILGLGNDRSPYTHADLPFRLPEHTVWHLEPGDFEPSQATLGWLLAAYRYTPYRKPARTPAQLALPAAADAHHTEALHMARAARLARDLVNAPANHLGPMDLAQAAVTLGHAFGAHTTVITGTELEAAYPAIAAVGAGSHRSPAVARFTWSGSTAAPDAPLLSLVGKGVVFDTGGYDLKPPAGMLRMKKDMGGAALLLALAAMVMQSDLPLRLDLRIGCVENMVGGAAMRPGDILRTRNGLTVEIGNTDAEGRLVLCDLLAEASAASPTLLVDAATLTGAARVALGPDLPALFTNDDRIAETLLAEGAARHDPLWRLPLHAAYAPWLDSPVADLNNVATKPMAGAIVAALFLERFVADATSWVHIDTYAWNDTTRPGRPEGGEALGLRALFGIARNMTPN